MQFEKVLKECWVKVMAEAGQGVPIDSRDISINLYYEAELISFENTQSGMTYRASPG